MPWGHNGRRRVKDYARETNVGWDYTPAEIEFMMAMERFMRLRDRRFPDCRDVLEVAKSLGYRKAEG